MVATVGEDEFGEFLVERLENEGIDTTNIRRSRLNTTLAHAALDEEARPHFMFYRGADEVITREQLNGTDSDIVHLGSLPFSHPKTARNLIEFIEGHESTISFDPNLREDVMNTHYRKSMQNIVDHVDVMIAAEDEIDFFGGKQEVLSSVDELVVTKGEKGAELCNGAESFQVDAPDVDVVDTTGAGDALTGAYLAFRDEGRKKALQKAVKAASRSVTSKGAMEALPYRSELE